MGEERQEEQDEGRKSGRTEWMKTEQKNRMGEERQEEQNGLRKTITSNTLQLAIVSLKLFI